MYTVETFQSIMYLFLRVPYYKYVLTSTAWISIQSNSAVGNG